jgi:ABC-2 type transport system permease protein
VPIHDLGYKSYVGVRRPHSANTWTLARQGLRRAVAPFVVKASLILACFAVVIYPLAYLISSLGRVTTRSGTERGLGITAEGFVRGVFDWQVWLFVFIITIAAGASAVADDVQNRAFQYYFSKPVSREQYMFGRIVPVAFLAFLLTFGPALILVILAAAVAPDKAQATTAAGLAFPALIYGLLVSVVMGTLSVAVSAFSRSKGLTMTLWASIFFLPHVVAFVVKLVAKSNWLYLTSLPGCLGICGDAIFKRAGEGQVQPWQALLALVVYVAAGLYLLRRKLLAVEVIG